MDDFDNFISLPEEKKQAIIDGALRAFGATGYKKTSTAEIAAESGISKAMVFHYFGTKKKLYLYLLQMCGNMIIDALNNKMDRNVTDFFDRIKQAGDIKMELIKQQPAILSFLLRVYFETAAEVRDAIKQFLTDKQFIDFRDRLAFAGMDGSKFKDDVDPKLILKMLVWMSQGALTDLTRATDFDLETYYKDFTDCLNLLKKAFYK
ncbi:TetR family transcriptional regulator [Sporolactobacillus spathodeae]|uniref:AcrR family transcriptional regulator n=1 Tax=Sporolactobacillus spathodeae TaxID=1465502 RepID=A0ABS2Q897_9BACL|nr:AcrR family transcriptional regulator [Sporolactobacillus spathodeae]